jgi:hypothetical protein
LFTPHFHNGVDELLAVVAGKGSAGVIHNFPSPVVVNVKRNFPRSAGKI